MAKLLIDLNKLSPELREALFKEIKDDEDAGNDDWQLIVDHLHDSGKKKRTLSASESWSVYLEADGFGDLRKNPAFLAGINGGWDWSHVRDSSEEAIQRMANKIREIKRTHDKKESRS